MALLDSAIGSRALIPPRSVLLWSDRPDVYVRAAEAAGLTASFNLETVTFPADPSDDVLARAEAMLAWRPAKGLATRAPKLRWIHSLTGGCEHWLASPDLPRQVVLTCARGSHVPQMPEHIFAGLFVASKDIPGIVLDQRERHWRRRVNDTLAGQTLGILGLGAIGCEVARKAAAFDMRVIGTKRAPGPVPHVAQVFGADGNERVLAEADYVLLLLPATTETRGMINTRTLGLMKPGAWLLNFGRGDLVVDADLVAAVSAGRIAGAVLDVFVQEPLPESSPLWTTKNIVIFPHVGGLHPQRDDLVAKLWVQNLRRFAAGEPLRDVVDPARGY